MRKVICILFLIIPSVFFSQLMRIGIFSRDKINRLTVSYSEYSYSIYVLIELSNLSACRMTLQYAFHAPETYAKIEL